MKNLIAITTASLLTLSLVGCGGGESADNAGTSGSSSSTASKSSASDFTGSWQVDKESMREIMMEAIMAEAPEGATDEQKQMMQDMAGPMIDGMSVNLSINEDKTFAVSMQMMGEAEETTGTWSVGDGVITMTETAEEGEAPSPATGTIEDGKLVINFPNEEGGPQKMVMIRG